MSDSKVARLKHDRQSITKGERSVEEYLAQIKRFCDVLATSGHKVSDVFVGAVESGTGG